jgi:hypothetical protein
MPELDLREINWADKPGEYATASLFAASPKVVALAASLAPLFRPINLFAWVFPIPSDASDNLTVHLALADATARSVFIVALGALA